MDRPWFKFHSRDWLDNKELRRCSSSARGVLADLMALANEGKPYGYLADQVGALTENYMANRFHIPLDDFRNAVEELKSLNRLHVDNEGTMKGTLLVKRMVDDERVRLKRAEGGKKSIEHPNTYKPKGTHDGTHIGYLNGGVRSRAIRVARADSDSTSLSEQKTTTPEVSLAPAFDVWFERQYNRHPKKRDKILGEQCAVQHFNEKKFTLASFEATHIAWCGSEEWRWKNGAKTPTLAQWISDEGYRYMPPDSDLSELPGHMNPGLIDN